MPPNATYGQEFIEIFTRELEQRGHPAYPHRKWFIALECADREAPCTSRRRELIGQHLRNDERYWKSGVRTPDYDGWDAVRVSLDISIRRFWQKRYGF